MTRKDYYALADAIATTRIDYEYNPDALSGVSYVTRKIADVLAADNPRFDRARFFAACNEPQTGGFSF